MRNTKIIIYSCGEEPVIEEVELTDDDKVIGDDDKEYYTPYNIARRLLGEVQDTYMIQTYSLQDFPGAIILMDEEGRMKRLPANRYFYDRDEKIKIAGRFIICMCAYDSHICDYALMDPEEYGKFIDQVFTEIIEDNYGDGTDHEFKLEQSESDDIGDAFECYECSDVEDVFDIIKKLKGL